MSPRSIRNGDSHSLIVGPKTNSRHQVELPAHLVPDEPIGLGFGDPIGQELIGILPAMSQAQRDAGQVAKKRCRQGILAVDGENDRRVEPCAAQPVDDRELWPGARARGRRLHPGGVVDHQFIDPRDELAGCRARRRSHEGETAIVSSLAQSAEGRRGHQDVAHGVKPDAKHVAHLPPVVRQVHLRHHSSHPSWK